MMRRLSFICAILAIFLVAAVGTVSAAQDSTLDKVIHAAGSGNVVGTPDRAQITFSVQTENPDVKVAQADNAGQMAKVVRCNYRCRYPEGYHSRPPGTASAPYMTIQPGDP